MVSDKNYVWLDLEMTGLSPDKDVILEIATAITDDQLNLIAKGPEFVIHQPEEKLALMDDWVKNAHTKSGLITQVRGSQVTMKEAQDRTFAFIKQYCKPQTAVFAGNSVWQDRIFLYFYMKPIVEFMHYRIIDVSSVKCLVRSWYPGSPYLEFKKSDKHRASEDVMESIAELKHFRTHFFRKP